MRVFRLKSIRKRERERERIHKRALYLIESIAEAWHLPIPGEVRGALTPDSKWRGMYIATSSLTVRSQSRAFANGKAALHAKVFYSVQWEREREKENMQTHTQQMHTNSRITNGKYKLRMWWSIPCSVLHGSLPNPTNRYAHNEIREFTTSSSAPRRADRDPVSVSVQSQFDQASG